MANATFTLAAALMEDLLEKGWTHIQYEVNSPDSVEVEAMGATTQPGAPVVTLFLSLEAGKVDEVIIHAPVTGDDDRDEMALEGSTFTILTPDEAYRDLI